MALETRLCLWCEAHGKVWRVCWAADWEGRAKARSSSGSKCLLSFLSPQWACLGWGRAEPGYGPEEVTQHRPRCGCPQNPSSQVTVKTGTIQMAKKHMKIHSTLLIIRAMQIETTLRYNLITVRMVISKKSTNNRSSLRGSVVNDTD